MICTESYFGVADMHIAVVACKPPKPEAPLELHVSPKTEVKCPFFFKSKRIYCPCGYGHLSKSVRPRHDPALTLLWDRLNVPETMEFTDFKKRN